MEGRPLGRAGKGSPGGESPSPESPSAARKVELEELHLPEGYWLEWDPDVLVLRRPDGSEVAAFSAEGARPGEIERAAREDYRER